MEGFVRPRNLSWAHGTYLLAASRWLEAGNAWQTSSAISDDLIHTAAENSAPVCEYINRNALMPNADLISTFSLLAYAADYVVNLDLRRRKRACRRSEQRLAGRRKARRHPPSLPGDLLPTCSQM